MYRQSLQFQLQVDESTVVFWQNCQLSSTGRVYNFIYKQIYPQLSTGRFLNCRLHLDFIIYLWIYPFCHQEGFSTVINRLSLQFKLLYIHSVYRMLSMGRVLNWHLQVESMMSFTDRFIHCCLQVGFSTIICRQIFPLSSASRGLNYQVQLLSERKIFNFHLTIEVLNSY